MGGKEWRPDSKDISNTLTDTSELGTTHQLMWCYHSLAEQSDKLHLSPSPTLIFQLYSSIAHLGVGNKLLWKPRVTETWLNVLIYLQSDIKPGVKGMNGSICRCVVPWWWLACSPWTLAFCNAFIAFFGMCVCVCARRVRLHLWIDLCLHHHNNDIIIKMYLFSSVKTSVKISFLDQQTE